MLLSFEDLRVGFIGGGNMASAIGKGLLLKGVLKASQLYVSAPSQTTLDSWKEFGVNTTNNNGDIIENCHIILLAFKPSQLQCALENVKKVKESKLFVSILVGVSCTTIIAKLKEYAVDNPRLVRIMPNLAVATGEGCSVLYRDVTATPEDVKIVTSLFSHLGFCEEIPENLMEPVAALIGSGPAYIFLVIESLADGAVKHGVPRKLALNLAAQTVLGASKVVLETKVHPGQLKDNVCSPGGTTICGIHELEKGNLRSTFMNAIQAATERAKEIKRNSSQ